MPVARKVPSYRLHRASGQAIVTLPLGFGQRKDVLLGPFGSSQSRLEYARVLAEWEAGGRTILPAGPQTDLTVAELLVKFLTHAQTHYRTLEGEQTSEYGEYVQTLRPLRQLFAHSLAREFSPL